VFWKDAWGKVCEENRVCIGVMGKVGRGALDKRRGIKGDETFLWAKGIVESLAEGLRLKGLCLRPADNVVCGRGESVDIVVGEKRIGFVGLLRSDLRHKHRMSDPVAVAEFKLEPIIGDVFTTPVYKPIAHYPAISRDMAIVVDSGVQHGDIEKIIQKVAPAELTGVELFDIFTGGEMKQGKKSLAYSLTYRSFERTLTDEDANGYHEHIKDALKSELGVEIREG
jgi:phenylalanyl-tRNA synthetase beta chain